MTAHRITYEGPASLAVRAATQLANADGIELTSAGSPEHREGSHDTVLLALTVEGTTEAVTAAVELIRHDLPAEAGITIDPPSTASP